MQYKLHLTLQQKAALQCAIQFWGNKEIRDKVVEFIESYDKIEIHDQPCNISDDWCKFTKTVIEELNRDELPKTLEVELIHMVKMIGDRILGWHCYIKDTYAAKKEAINRIDKIYWTPYGTVDAVQIFKSTWLENPSFDTTKLYEFACNHVMVDYINDLWTKIPSGLQDSYDSGSVNRLDQHLLVYWKCCRNGDLSNLMRYLEIAAEDFNRQDLHEFNYIYDVDRSTEVNMLRLSVHQGHFLAVKYFWEKLTEEERDGNVLKCARIAVSRCHYHKDRSLVKNHCYGNRLLTKNYITNQYVEICIFLMNQMTRSQKKEFFNTTLKMSKLQISNYDELDVRDEILKMLLSGWPWQELFMVVLKDMIQLLDDDSMIVCMFMDLITKRMLQDYCLVHSIEMSNYRNILHEAWLIIPGTIKRKLPEQYHLYTFISYLISMRDLDSLKLILNDPEIADVRDRYIRLGRHKYERLIEDDEYEILEQFIQEMFKSEEEKKRFKQQIEPWFSLIIEDKFHLADKFLDWACSVPEERQSVKNGIDHQAICETLIYECNFKLFDKFLDWICMTEEEKKSCKDQFKDKKYMIMNITHIWSKNKNNLKLAQDISSEFLNWLLESEEKAELLKKEIFVDLEITPIIVYYFAELKRENIMNDLLIWLLAPDEEIQRIEQLVSQPNPIIQHGQQL